MYQGNFKKMAGTAAVFLAENYAKACPVERDGMSWSCHDLHLAELTQHHQPKPDMDNVLALEGLEEYDPPEDGDIRRVKSMQAKFIYHQRVRGWVQLV